MEVKEWWSRRRIDGRKDGHIGRRDGRIGRREGGGKEGRKKRGRREDRKGGLREEMKGNHEQSAPYGKWLVTLFVNHLPFTKHFTITYQPLTLQC